MGRHRYTACVRSDGLLATVGPLLDRRRVVAATLVDVSSGLVLDGYSHDPALSDLELLGAAHADLARAAAVLAPTAPGGEFIVSRDGRYHHVLRPVADPHEDPLMLSVVVHGSHRHAVRVHRHLGRVPVAALTTGPVIDPRLLRAAWSQSRGEPGSGAAPTPDPGLAVAPAVPAVHDRGSPPAVPARAPGTDTAASPPSAIAPVLPPTHPMQRG